MKLQFLVDGETPDENEYLTIYLCEKEIIAFFVPDDTADYVDELLNIILSNGDRYTVVQTKELISFLTDKFKL